MVMVMMLSTCHRREREGERTWAESGGFLLPIKGGSSASPSSVVDWLFPILSVLSLRKRLER